MRARRCACLTIVLLVPAFLYAGQIYGTVVSEKQGVKGANIEIQCPSAEVVTGATAADGAYRINVPKQGQCTFALTDQPGRPSATIFSSPNPTAYNFELVKGADGKPELRRR